MLFGPSQRTALDFRIKIVAFPVADVQQPRLMVDSRDQRANARVIFHLKPREQLLCAYLHAVAQADGLHRRIALHVAGQHGHGVGVIQKPCIGADGGHIIRKILQNRNRAQRAKNTANAQRVANRLAKAIFFRHFKIRYRTRLVQPHLNGVYHIRRAAKRIPAVFVAKIRGNHRMTAHVVVQRRQHPAAVFQPRRINIIQGKFAVFKHRREHAVAHHVLDENTGSRAHKDNFSHAVVPPIRRNVYFIYIIGVYLGHLQYPHVACLFSQCCIPKDPLASCSGNYRHTAPFQTICCPHPCTFRRNSRCY